MARDIREKLNDETIVALSMPGSDWPRGLLSATMIPDKWMGLVRLPDGRRRFVAAGEEPRADEGARLVLVRNQPITVPLVIGDVRATCGNLVGATAEVLVRWSAREDDLTALHDALLTQSPLTLDRLAEVVSSSGGVTALRELIRDNSAKSLLEDDHTGTLYVLLAERLKRFLFESGLSLERVARLNARSETFVAHQQREQRKADRVEQIRAKETVEAAARAAMQRRLEGLDDVLSKLRDAASADADMHWHDLLPALAPGERAQLLENLWRVTPDATNAGAITLIAGDAIHWADPQQPSTLTRKVELPNDLGGLRSIGFAPETRSLLVGAAIGVWQLDADTGEIRNRFVVSDAPTDPPRTGFNACTVVDNRLYATSSHFGCWSWSLDDPDDARAILPPESGVPSRVRGVCPAGDGRVAFAADDCVHLYDAKTESLSVLGSATDTIHALASLGDHLYAGTGKGEVYRIDPRRPDDWWLVQRVADRVESIHPRRWNDLVELVIPAGKHGVSGVFDELRATVTLFETPQPVRRAWACDDLIVALNAARDRLFVLSAAARDRRGADILVARETGHTIQDACIVLSA